MKAKTKIEIDPLFADKWDAAYVVHHKKENRNYVVLRNSKTKKMNSMQYAKYLLSIKLGRVLTREETVDHIDNDKTNDSPDNLQVLSRADNVRKCTALRKSTRIPRHGTLTEATHYKCRCEACSQALRDYNRALYLRRKANKG